MVRSHTLFSEILHIPESLYSGGDSLIEMVTKYVAPRNQLFAY